MVWISLTPTRRQCCIWMAMKENMSPPPHAVNILHIYLFWTWGTETLAKIFPHGPNHESSKSQPGKFVKVCVCVLRGSCRGRWGGRQPCHHQKQTLVWSMKDAVTIQTSGEVESWLSLLRKCGKGNQDAAADDIFKSEDLWPHTTCEYICSQSECERERDASKSTFTHRQQHGV